VQVDIFDVEHGFCAAIQSPSGRLMLVDCGHNSTTGWRPSTWLGPARPRVDTLVITNADEDHVSDLPNVRPYVSAFKTNWHLTPEWIERAKRSDGIGPGIRSLIDMMRTSPGDAAPIDWGMEVRHFCHPTTLFSDENSLSLVTFIRHLEISIVFAGDLTREGWQQFLTDPVFVQWLQRTNIFVASHHGRQDGYCPDVFGRGRCNPRVVIISDKAIMHDTQDVDYGHHALGIQWGHTGQRKVLSTRRDGSLTISSTRLPGFHIQVHG